MSYIAYIGSCPDGYIIYNPILPQLGLHSILLPNFGYAIVYAQAKASDRNTNMDVSTIRKLCPFSSTIPWLSSPALSHHVRIHILQRTD